jgi:hypothetical protein
MIVMSVGRLAAAMAVVGALATAAEAQRFNWNEIGTTFCQHAIAGDVAGMAPILSPSLQQLIAAAGRRGDVPPRILLQSYDAPAPRCEVRTRNAAIVEIARTASGSGITWVDYLVVAPEPDGTTRIDDILFSTRRSDTLRERLRLILTP